VTVADPEITSTISGPFAPVALSAADTDFDGARKIGLALVGAVAGVARPAELATTLWTTIERCTTIVVFVADVAKAPILAAAILAKPAVRGAVRAVDAGLALDAELT